MLSIAGSRNSRRRTLVKEEQVRDPGIEFANSEVEMGSIIHSVPAQVAEHTPPMAAQRLRAQREERGQDVLDTMARFGINPILNDGSRAFPSIPPTDTSLSDSQPSAVT